MTIYTRCGAPVRFLAAEQRTRWYVRWPGRANIYDQKPSAKQVRGGKVESFPIWWIKAEQVGAYPDGSGVHMIGKPLRDGAWLDENEFRADDGIREIHAECEMKESELSRTSRVNKKLSKALFMAF